MKLMLDPYYLITPRLVCNFAPSRICCLNELFTKHVTFLWNELGREQNERSGGGMKGRRGKFNRNQKSEQEIQYEGLSFFQRFTWVNNIQLYETLFSASGSLSFSLTHGHVYTHTLKQASAPNWNKGRMCVANLYEWPLAPGIGKSNKSQLLFQNRFLC